MLGGPTQLPSPCLARPGREDFLGMGLLEEEEEEEEEVEEERERQMVEEEEEEDEEEEKLEAGWR
ncbi:hypothetical protein E2C01_100921 [Portunus trituberculatus]|uniref:Uncharacterized protein n=1 Tax=Portunus trituberculatus TaxID=210409 RepID=A0A5B7KDF3_PORTR|nr:hypothetical protein [Portunus trituberculatus]